MPEQDVEAVYRRYFPAIREKCRRILRDPEEAQDVAQETFIRMWGARLSDEDPLTTTAWIYKTSTRLAIDRLRQRKNRSGLLERESAVSPTVTGSGADLVIEARQQLEKIAAHVPAKELEVAVLHRVDGLDQLEVAQVTGLSDRTVRRLLKTFDERALRLETRGSL